MDEHHLDRVTCPACNYIGLRFIYFDHLIEKWVVEFNCEDDPEHHFLIVQLPPTEYEEMEGE